MEISQIKRELSILRVLSGYGLTPDRNGRLRCPFHDDKTPSMQIYPSTNTFCCFSANCHAGTGDVIQFIQLKENCSKHEALLQATALLTEGMHYTTTHTSATTLPTDTDTSVKEAVMDKLFRYFAKSLPLTKKAVAYLEGRGIDYRQHQIGYNSGDWHHRMNEGDFIQSCVGCGLLKPNAAVGFSAWAKSCIVFPLKDREGKITSLYARCITDSQDQRHFYLSGRRGLYPCYPPLTTKKLLLTESIIDAASLLQQPGIAAQYSVVALYGTNGLTGEHTGVIMELPQLDEIVLVLDGDEAGEKATTKHAHTLHAMLPQLRITQTNLPRGEDINSILGSHDDAVVLQHVIDGRTEFFFSLENKQTTLPETVVAVESSPLAKLDTRNPELLIYNNCELKIEIWGGIKITGLDRMKVSLKVLHLHKPLLPIRDTVDLYSRIQTEQLVQTISDNLDTNIQQTQTVLCELTNELEQYRLCRIEAMQPKPKTLPIMGEAARQTALHELRQPNLLQRTSQLIGLSGMVGEETNRLVAYLIYTKRKQEIPLHVMFLGASGSGKTYLQEKISELIPEEDKIEITQITENALYYFKQEELKHKLILIEDLDGASTVFYPLRELQTKRRISKTVTLKDSKGNLKTITLTVEGPVCVSGCTTKEKIYEDNANRCILLYTDQTKEQDKKINDYQTQLAAGEVDKERENRYKELFKNMQRLLRPLQVVNPYAKYIQLPDQVFKPRRTMTLLLGFIEAVTFYHQCQREVKKTSDGRLYIETTIDDIEAAFTLLGDVLFSKSDELTRAARTFLEKLKQYLADNAQESFTVQQVRKVFRIEPRTLQRYIRELKQYGFLRQVSGYRHRKGFEYAVADTGEYQQLKSEIQSHLQAILHKLPKK